MLNDVHRAEVETVRMYEPCRDSRQDRVRYLVWYWRKNRYGNDRESCFIFYDGPESYTQLKEAEYIARQLTK